MLPAKSNLRASAQVFIPKAHQTVKSYKLVPVGRKTASQKRITYAKLK